MKTILTMMLVFGTYTAFAQDSITGKVISSPDSASLPGAVIILKEQGIAVSSDEQGKFLIKLQDTTGTLVVSYIGYKMITMPVAELMHGKRVIVMHPDASQLAEVQITDGYQSTFKERVTGSFSRIDRALLNRRVSTDLLSRLEDTAPGLIFNKGVGAAAGMTIRGRSTISSNASPLIIIDNFPYEGDLNLINPNDIENVTLLKDAAASSIWGARAGNGVIVITTKQGGFNQTPTISFNSNLTVGKKPDLYYIPQISSADFVDFERRFFAEGRYNSAESHPNRLPFTPVVETLIAQRDGRISPQQADAQIEIMKLHDVRRDYDQYFYQSSMNQQYALSFQGGSAAQRYFLSAGYDRNRSNTVGNNFERLTVNATNHYRTRGQKLEISTAMYFSHSRAQTNGFRPLSYTSPLTQFSGMPVYPYARLADSEGNPLAIIHEYRFSYLDKTRQEGLLDWTYRPLEELGLSDNSSKQKEYRLNTNLSYNLVKGLEASVRYQYQYMQTADRNHQPEGSYTTRSLINRFTIQNPDGTLTRPVPLGGILDKSENMLLAHQVRSQLKYQKLWAGKHDLVVLAGTEVRLQDGIGSIQRLYGYNDRYATSQAVDYGRFFTSYVNPASTFNRIPYRDNQSETTDRFLSYYSNVSYMLAGRYSLTGSIRYDQSNLFGVSANQRGVPLYSFGGAWNLHEEGFYKSSLVPYLKLRATYGYSGMINNNMSAFTTAYFSSMDRLTALPYATIQNPPNPNLRWEKTRTINVGIDFESRNRRIDGSLDWYTKKGTDIIGTLPLPGSSGVREFTGNYAGTSGQGVDLALNVSPFSGRFGWIGNFLFSYVTDRVTSYAVKTFPTNYIQSGNGQSIFPMEGRPLFAYYALPYAGLDPATGNPLGYLNGELSTEYSSIINSATADNILYVGPARPTVYGAFRNTIRFKDLSVTLNTSYRLGYFFRRSSVNYSNLLAGYWPVHGDYEKRWKQPGDEAHTQVPSMPAQVNYSRDNFYGLSQALIQRADHIRLQDININYTLIKPGQKKQFVSRMEIYLYANNIGILWKRYKGHLDPDSPMAAPAPRALSFGTKLDF